ncbi:MAG: tRNA1(Val) (adenine(37)-N6)-methyltransferase [Clostridia bacterium]|nr:tRNA1(Val) (adenine(37)-N6)-methyltransferase [Clostridia bacterium]
MEILLNENERIDDLELNNLKIIQNKNYFCFGMDSVILSDFAKNIKNNSNVIDLGTGTGILGILLSAKTNIKQITGIEIQKEVFELAKRNIKLNNLENKFNIINEDINNLKKILKNNSYDVVITNPPYKKINSGKISENEINLISRHEVKCNLENVIEHASFLLKDKGEFYMVHRPERLPEIITNLKKYKIEPKIIKFVYPNKNKNANLILIKAIKNARSFLVVEEPIIVYNENGTYTDEILKIYGKNI